VAATARIRPATEADLPRLLELLAQLSLDSRPDEPAAASEQTYRRALQEITTDRRQHLFVLEEEGAVIGTVTLVIVPNLTHNGRPYAILENVVVDEASRSSGHGELLVRHAMAKAERAGCYKLALTSNKQRAAAHRFYQRLGFRAASEGFRIDFP
jgi:N-acetylglutamate synthase-like GNAT family acetyltransferase